MLKHLIESDIIPDYVCTSESNMRIIEFFVNQENKWQKFDGDPLKLAKYCKDVICVISRKTRSEVKEVIDSLKFKDVITINDDDINNSSNIGLFCAAFADRYLESKKIILIGFDHAHKEGYKPKYDPKDGSFETYRHPDFHTTQILDPVFQIFRDEFLRFAPTSKTEIINATEGGSLYGEGITCMRFEDCI